MSVNKSELVDAIAAGAGLSKAQAEGALNAFIDAVQGAVSAGDRVALPGFGTFASVDRKARTARNPQGVEIHIPARRAAKFTVGSKFKAQVAGS